MRALAPGALLLAVAGAAALAPPLAGQEEEARTLTLADALRVAEGANPTYRRAVNETLLNGTEMRTRWLESLLPSASLDLVSFYRGNLQRTSQDNFGNPIANPTADWVYFSNTTQNLNLSWNIQGLSLFQEHRQQRLVNQGRDLAERGALTDVQMRVRLLYMDALEQRELMELQAELLEARRTDHEVAERLFSLALRTRVDVLQAELAVEQQALTLQQQEATYRTALLELQAELGAEYDRPLELVAEALPIFDPTGFDAEALVRRALEVNPRLLASGHAIETASHALSRERNDWWPRISLGVNVFRRAQAPDGGALFSAALDEDLESQFQLSFSLPITNDFFGSRERRAQASVALRNQRESDREARLEVEKTVRGAVLDLDNQWESLRLNERAREIAGEAVRLAREEYRLGTLRFEDLRPILDNEADTRRRVITARHAFVEALQLLEQAVGGRVRPSGASPGPPGI